MLKYKIRKKLFLKQDKKKNKSEIMLTSEPVSLVMSSRLTP